jgi:curved DNA-binding protein CbpA
MSPHEPDPYAILDLAPSATPQEIRAAYQKLARKFHPDLHQGNPLEELASARLVEINHAYHLLSDPARRAAYDAGVPARGRAAGFSKPPARRVNKGLLVGLLSLIVVPLGFRLGPVVVRGLVALARTLFEAARGLPGGLWTAAAALGVAVLAVVGLKRR